MSKHTPGPWRPGNWGASVVSDSPVECGINGSDAIESYGGHLIAESISECNRPLILAAPDLLEALELLIGKAYKQNFNDSYPEILAKAEAALAKARGEQ